MRRHAVRNIIGVSPKPQRLSPSSSRVLACCAVFLACVTVPAHASVVYVTENGADGVGCGAAASSGCATVKYAVEVVAPTASSPVTVSIGAGHFSSSSCNATILQDMDVVGAGMGATVIDCENLTRAFQAFLPATHLSFEGFTVMNGYADNSALHGANGGAIYVQWISETAVDISPQLLFKSVSIINSTAVSPDSLWLVGGGIGVAIDLNITSSGGEIVVSDCHLYGNVVNSLAGGDAIGGGFGFLSESDVLLENLVVIVQDSVFVDNAAPAAGTSNDDGGGIALYYYGEGDMINTTYLVTRSVCDHNFGGGICIEVDGATYSGNITVEHSLFRNNTEIGPGCGIYAEYSTDTVLWSNFMVHNVSVHGNIAFPEDGVHGKSVTTWYIDGDGIVLQNSLNSFNGGGMWFNLNAGSFNGLLSITDSRVYNNTAISGKGGGICIEVTAGELVWTEVELVGNYIADNVAYANGGGVYLWSQGDAHPIDTEIYQEFRQWISNASALLVNNTIVRNTAAASGSSGGGLSIENGFDVVVADTIIVNNSASLYGGGVYMDATPNSLHFMGSSVLSHNRVSLGTGAQLASFAGGDVGFGGVRVEMDLGPAQVLIQAGGNVTASDGTAFTCPNGYLFRDLYGELFGESAALMTQPGFVFPVLVSTLLFECEACPPGMYTMEAGWSAGEPGEIVNPQCLSCPYGGVCTTGGAVTSAGGFWGTVVTLERSSTDGGPSTPYNAVEFMQCPDGYCCDGNDNSPFPCTKLDACSGNRTGRLCGMCMPGYGEVLGSSACRLATDCEDGFYLWPLATVGLLIVGTVMLRNSGIWVPADKKYRASGLVKFTSYFYQMVPLVVISTSWGSSTSSFRVVLDELFTLLRLQAPTSPNGRGMCLFPNMTIGEKLSWGYITPALIAVSMIICVCVGELSRRHCNRDVIFIIQQRVLSTSLDADEQAAAEPPRRTVFAVPIVPLDQEVSSTASSLTNTQLQGTLSPGTGTMEFPGGFSNTQSVGDGPDNAPSTASSCEPDANGSDHNMDGPALTSKTLGTSVDDAAMMKTPQRKTTTSTVFSGWVFPRSKSRQAGAKVAPASGVAPSTRIVNVLPLKTRLKGAALNWFLFTYTSALSATLKLLSCVDVPGSSHKHLFLDANLDCSGVGWMAPLYVVLVLLVAIAVAMPWITIHLHKHRSVHRGMYKVLTDPYTEECFWWESVLLWQRLVLSFFNTFLVQYPVFRLVLAGLVCLVCSFLHLLYRPVKHAASHDMQTVFQFCLLAVIMVNIAVGQLVQDAQDDAVAVKSAANSLSLRFHNVLDLLFVYVLPVGVLFYAIGRRMARWAAVMVTSNA